MRKEEEKREKLNEGERKGKKWKKRGGKKLGERRRGEVGGEELRRDEITLERRKRRENLV